MNKKIEPNINELHEYLRIGKSFDIVARDIAVGDRKGYIVFVDGLSKDIPLMYIIDALQNLEQINVKTIPQLVSKLISYIEVETSNDFEDIQKKVLSGNACILIDGFYEAILIDTRTYPVRGPEEPDLEKITRGSRDGLVETIIFNTALIRRRIRDKGLLFEMFEIGKRSKSDVVLGYIEDLADPKLVKEIKEKIQLIDLDSLVMNEKSIVEAILPNNFLNPFPQVRYSERPDVVAAHILEGHCVIITDNSPSVIILPTTIFHFMQHSEDFTQTPVIGNYIRFIRYILILLSFFLTPLWLLLVENQELLPEFLSFIGPKEAEYTIPLIYQFLILEFGIDSLKTASIHTPSSLSTSLGIIGGLLLSQFAVDVGWFIPETILYSAVVAIGQYSTPSIEFSYAIRLFRLLLLILTAIFGLWGFIGGLLLIIVCAATNKTLSYKGYLYPLFPLNLKDLSKMLIRRHTLNKK